MKMIKSGVSNSTITVNLDAKDASLQGKWSLPSLTSLKSKSVR
jgi:hypothetical protein